MPLVTRAVFGFVYRTDGTPLAAAPVSIRSFAGVFQPDGSVAPATLLAPITNSVGRYDVVLVVNARYLIGIPGDVFEIIVPSGAGSISVESLRATTGVVMTNTFQLLLDAALLLKENALGNPGAAGQFLTSTLLGARSWATPPAGGGGAEALEAVKVIGAASQPAYENGWGPNAGVSFYKDRGRGYMYISGYNPTAIGGQTAWTLPVGYRPTLTIYFYEFFQGITRRWKIDTNGAVVYEGSNGAVLSEIGVDFRLA